MGPLQGIRIIEIGGLGPGPFAGMLLADLGADLLRIERPPGRGVERILGLADVEGSPKDIVHRGRPAVGLDLSSAAGRELLLTLVTQADGLFEGFRPGVAERLGIGPDEVLARNPRLVYGRVTGYGQDGPMAAQAGHDINYISIAGALRGMVRSGGTPVPPLNLLGDYGGGGMLLALGLLAGIIEARESGQGQVIDAAMVDGVALLTARIHSLRAGGSWREPPGTNLLDTGAPFYEVYETADSEFMSVGAIEPRFYADLVQRLGLSLSELPAQYDRASWPATKEQFAGIFRLRTRAQWVEVFAGSDACCTPVLSLAEASEHPQIRQRRTLAGADFVQPQPAPRFSRTPAEAPRGSAPAALPDILRGWGIDHATITPLLERGTLAPLF